MGVLASVGSHISTSMVSPAISRRITDEHARHRQDYIAASVLGRPDASRKLRPRPPRRDGFARVGRAGLVGRRSARGR